MFFAHKSIANHKISHTDLLDDFYKNPLQYILLFPTNRKVRDFTLQVLTKSSHKAISLSNLHTIYTLAQTLFTEGNPKYKLISDPEAGLLLNKIIEKNKAKLKHLNFKNYIPQGSVEKLRMLIREYKRNGVDAEMISKLVPQLTNGREHNKAHDIALIYKEYAEELAKLERFEIGDVYRVIKAKDDAEFKSRLDEQFPGLTTIVVYGYASFSDPEIKLLKRLSLIEGIKLYIEVDYAENNNALFASAKDTIEMLEKNEFTEIQALNIAEANPLHDSLRRELFNVHKLITSVQNKKWALANSTNGEKQNKLILKNLKEYATTEYELRGITVQIKQLLKENAKLNPSDFAVVARDLTPYAKIAPRAFSQAGIPLNSTARMQLSEMFSVSALLTLLDVVATAFHGKSIERCYLTFLGDDKNLLPELQAVLKYSKKMRGLSSILQSIEDLKPRAKTELYKYGLTPESIEHAELLMQWLIKKVRPFINKEGKDVITNCTPEFFKENYKKLIVDSGIIDQLLQMDEQYRELNIKALDRTIPIVDAVCDMIGYELREKGQEREQFKLFKDAIVVAFKNAKINAQEIMNQGVLMTNFDEIRGLKARYLFIAGLNEGIAPAMFTEDSLYVDPASPGDESEMKDRKKRALKDNLNAEKYLFYETLLVCSEPGNVYFSRYKQEKDQPFSKSMFLDYLIPFYPVIQHQETNVETLVSVEEAETVAMELYLQDTLNENAEFSALLGSELLEKLKHTQQFESFEEQVESEEARTQLTYYSENKKFSATHFETYVRCGYKYLARFILNLKGELDIEDHEEHLLIGEVFHSIVEKYLREIIENFSPSNGEEYKSKLEASKQRLKEIAFDELIKNFLLFKDAEGSDSTYTIAAGWFFEVIRLVGNPNDANAFDYSLVGRFYKGELDALESTNNKKFIPWKFELEIDSNSTSVLGRSISGRIDRIDKNDEGNARVVDYKTGKGEFDPKLKKHFAYIQLPLYAEYVKQELLQSEEGEVDAVHITPKGKKYVNTIVTKKENLQAYLAGAIDRAREVPSEISGGKFHHSILDEKGKQLAGCDYCEYSGFCRMEDYFNSQSAEIGESENFENSSES